MTNRENAVTRKKSIANWMLPALLWVLCAPIGCYRLWRRRTGVLVLVPYAVLGLPWFLVTYAFLGVIAFAAFLPDLDLNVSPSAPRTVRYNEGHYESTFLETARDTRGAHELIRVMVEPKGGNGSHYHRNFEETFTLLEGQLTVWISGKPVALKRGQSMTAPRGEIHSFRNPGDTVTIMTVKVAPARGLEKSIRVAYGLDTARAWSKGTLMQNLWRGALMLGYSETYLPDIPAPIQEPLVGALAKIAQWLGKDQELKGFFE